MKKYGYEVLAHLEGDVQKKKEDAVSRGNFYSSIIKNLKEYDTRLGLKQILQPALLSAGTALTR
ncbi:hypothetical protein HYX09_01530 [Candidatus Woesearchaeota archaeon]|nr:hypothetical protein [Candidatus Woesearchaeota archaeon]